MKSGSHLKRAIVAAVVMLVLAGASGCVKIISAPLLLPEEELAPADVIVVLGYGPPVDKDGKPVAEIMRRVKKGVEVYKAGLAPYIIVTGGNTYKSYYESAVMKEAAVSMGVAPEAIIEEREARDTIGNARYSARIMRERGWESAILVSSPYHLKRGRMLFEVAGVAVQTAGAETPDNPFYGITFSLYEYMVRLDYAFIDVEAEVRGLEETENKERTAAPIPDGSQAAP